MRNTPSIAFLAALLAVLVLAACSPGGDGGAPAPSVSDEAPAEPAQDTTEPVAAEPDAAGSAGDETGADAASPLAGTSWRLVNIASMDDTNHAPEDRDLYTLAFNEDGTVAIRADCNRGQGTWTSESASQLRFGPIAATMAMCPPESLHDRYLKQFEWVRSYVMEDGHLFLATMADGSIVEFEPVPAE